MECPDIRLAQPSNGSPGGAPPSFGQRSTRQRKLIFDILQSSDDHLDVETLYRKARDIDSRVSLSTVYRTISLLKDSDLVDELVFEDDRRCYEFKKESGHHHVRCMSCGEIMEFESACTERLKEKLESLMEFQVETIRIDVGGYCAKCRQR